MATSPTTAVSAASFVNSIGVNVHMWEATSGYGNVSLVENDLAYLGVANVRDNFQTSSVAAFSSLASLGYKLDFVASPASMTIQNFVTQVDVFNAAHPGSIKAIEGPNEVNIWTVNYNGGSSLANAAQYQQAFYSAVRADSHLSNIPVYNLSLAYLDSTQYAQVGDLSGSANYANSHAYLNNAYAPQWSFNIILPFAKLDATSLPTVITETGYNTDPNDGYSGVDQTVQAKYTLDTLMDAYKDGVATTYLYELLDDVADPGNTNAQYHYGLFNADGTPKLAATAIHNLTAILNDPGASSSFTPGTLNYSVSNLTAPYGNQLLLQKSNGAFDLVLWGEPKIYNPTTDTEIAAPNDTVTVNFAQVEGTVTVYDPLLGNTPIATYHNVQQIQVNITDHPLVVEISNGSTLVAGPPAPVVVGFSPDSNIVGDGITAMTVLTLTGTAAANSTVTVFDGAKQLGTATANASGTWSFTTGTLASASHSFMATATDAAGNTSVVSAALNVTVDAVAPGAPAISSISPDTGVAGDHITSAAVLTLTGTAEANSTVTVFDGAKQLGTATANASGAWSYTTGTLASASHSFTATATDAAGNTSVASAAQTMTVAGVAPGAPAISTISPDTGVVGDHITSAAVLTLTGTAEANSTVTVFDGAKQLGTATANASGAWSYTTGTLASASHSFTATATDAAGNTSVASAAQTMTVAGVAPGAPAISTISPDTGVVGDHITSAAVLTLTGTAAANSTVIVFDGAKQLGTATANASGVWNYTTGTLASAGHSFTATATDAAGNTSVVSAALNVTVDAVAPGAPAISSISPDTGVVGDHITSATVLTLTGTAEANSTVTVFDGAKQLGTATANASGAWSYTTGTLASASHSFTATATDAAGNTGVASGTLAVTVDATAPNAPIITSDAVVNSNAVLLTGTAEANSTVAVFEGTTQIGTVTASANGAWSFTTGPLPSGDHGFTATATDIAGNVSLVSQVIDPTIGTAGLIEIFGSTSLVEVGNNFFLDSNAGVGPELMYGSTPVVAGQFGAWTPIGAEQTANGYEIAWHNTSTGQYTVWNTDSNGHYLSNIGTVSGASATLETIETSFHQDLNGDGVIGIPTATGPTTVIESIGSTSLVEVGINFFLDNSAGTGPELQYGNAPVSAGQFGAWTPIGAEQTANGYEIAWHNTSTGQYTVWNTDSHGNYLSNIGNVSGTSAMLETLETSFHQDLNGDGVIGVATTVIESFGSTSLVAVGNNFLLDNSAGTGPELQYGNAPVSAGQFGAWTPIGAEQTGTGYEIAWHNGSTDQYTVWNTDTNGHYLSNIGTMSGTSAALKLLETGFHQDLNGDGQIGSGAAVNAGPVNIVTGTAGNNTITSTAANEILVGNGGNDTFVFGTSFGNNVITDFQASGNSQDILQFSQNTFSNFAAVLAHAAQVGSDVVITADALDTVTLQNVHLASLQKTDIHIA